MKIIVGLGNPGLEYQNNRHNVGYQVVDSLARKRKIKFIVVKKCLAELAKNDQLILVKAHTFMNESGKAVQAVLSYFKNQIKKQVNTYPDLIIIHDDLDLTLGNYKIQFAKGPKIHQGLQSIYQYLKTQQFWHIRIGVDSREGLRKQTGADYVLANFNQQEQKVIKNVILEVIKEIEQITTAA